VLLVAPGEVRIENDRGVVGGVTPDLFYRHIFARRLDPNGDFARMCLRAPHFRVINPIASHLEDKAMLGLLSAAVAGREADEIGLSDEEKDAIARTVPWTRVLDGGAAIGPGGERIDDLAGWARENGSALVLKRAWDYGGKGVFLGADLESPSTQARVQALLGRPGSWPELVDHALGAADAWVVQELVRAQPMKQVRVGPSGLEERELYLDLSAFTNLGVEPRPAGGAVRGAESRIVNILGGGGLAPLVLEEVLATALT
jgi:hypothetical protein